MSLRSGKNYQRQKVMAETERAASENAEGRNCESEYAGRILREGETKVAKLTDKDDIEAYLATFERTTAAYERNVEMIAELVNWLRRSLTSRRSLRPTEPGNLEETDLEVLSVPKSDKTGIAEGQLSLEIGDLVSACTMEVDLSQKVQALSKHSKPDSQFKFQKTFIGRCNRSFNHDWLGQHKWLCYMQRKVEWCFLHAMNFTKTPATQNELIEVMGKHIVLCNIVDELKAARWYAILADEVTSHNIEHLAICARFVDQNNNIWEEFLAFIGLDRITGAEIADAIIKFLQDNDDPVANVGTRLQWRQHPNVMEHCCRFFLNSPKQSGSLELIVTENVPDSSGRKPLLDICRTHWAERHNAYQHFYQAYYFIVQALELIGYRCHLDKYRDKYADWGTVNCTETQQILASITLFAFIVSFTCMYQYLSEINVKLQKRFLDIMDAHELIAEALQHMKVRGRMWTSVSITSTSKVSELLKVSALLQKCPESQVVNSTIAILPSFSVEDYFKKTVAIPLLDHIITSMKGGFFAAAIVASSLLGVIPSVLIKRS
eukprot:Em0006g195a